MNKHNEIDFDVLDYSRKSMYEIYLVLELIRFNPRIEYFILIIQRYHDLLFKNPNLSFIDLDQFRDYLHSLKLFTFDNLLFDDNTPKKQKKKFYKMFIEIMSSVDYLINYSSNEINKIVLHSIEEEFQRLNNSIITINKTNN